MGLPAGTSSDSNDMDEAALTDSEREQHHLIIAHCRSLATVVSNVWDREARP
jgi:hypothetical protein